MSTRHILRHIHFHGFVPFQRISSLQDLFVAQNLAHKASPHTIPAPIPTILTFTPNPVYTFGRRDQPTEFDPAFLERLREPLYPRGTAASHRFIEKHTYASWTQAEIVPTLRGGLTTFHGPGQLVIYPIFDLKSPYIRNSLPDIETTCNYPEGLDVRSYISLLENTTISVLEDLSIQASVTTDPGVWVSARHPVTEDSQPKKIAAVGVHLRRNITSYGTALNICPDLRWFERIVPCGLEGKETTSVFKQDGMNLHCEKEIDPFHKKARRISTQLAETWVRHFTHRIWGQNLIKDIQARNIPGDTQGDRPYREQLSEPTHGLSSNATDKAERARRLLGGEIPELKQEVNAESYSSQGLIQHIRIDSGIEKDGSVENLVRTLEEHDFHDPKTGVEVENMTRVTRFTFQNEGQVVFDSQYEDLRKARMGTVDQPPKTDLDRRDNTTPKSGQWKEGLDRRNNKAPKSDRWKERISVRKDHDKLRKALMDAVDAFDGTRTTGQVGHVEAPERDLVRRINSRETDNQERLMARKLEVRESLLEDPVNGPQISDPVRRVFEDAGYPMEEERRSLKKKIDELKRSLKRSVSPKPKGEERLAVRRELKERRKELRELPFEERRTEPRPVDISLQSDVKARSFWVGGVERFIYYPNNTPDMFEESQLPVEPPSFTGVRRYISDPLSSTPKTIKLEIAQVNHRNEKLRQSVAPEELESVRRDSMEPVRLVHVSKKLDARKWRYYG
jgi:lipoate-protein ligase B